MANDKAKRIQKKEWPITTRNYWGETQPWDWLRHVTPWPVLEWLFDRYHLCWAGMVMWKMGHGWAWDVERSCLHPHDYCGFYDQIATQAERDHALRIIGEAQGPTFTFKGDDGSQTQNESQEKK